MIKKKMTAIGDWMEDSLRSLLGRITPDGRIITIVILLLVFGGGSIYMTVSSIYNMGKKNAQQQMQIEHIKQLELERQQQADSVKLNNSLDYE
ncbi:hypothetical protein DSECCO2_391590 [anaerobic digester metagenome]